MRRQAPLLDRLAGGDRRSIGQAAAVARDVLAQPDLLPQLAEGLHHPDPLIVLRAADALEKVTRRRPDWLAPLRGRLLALMPRATQSELQWHLAQMLPRMDVAPPDARQATEVLQRWLSSPSRIVRVEAVTALAALASAHGDAATLLPDLMQRFAADPSPAMRARIRLIRQRLETGKTA